jgi:hypothetical protein
MVAMACMAFFLLGFIRKHPLGTPMESGTDRSSFANLMAFHLLLMGIGYLVFIIPTRWYFYFAESFDLRLLGPGFGLLWLSFFTFFSGKSTKTPILALCFFISFALFFTLPKQLIFETYQEIFWNRTGPVFLSR